jgi:hypothetical protein
VTTALKPRLSTIRRVNGVAGQIAYTVEVTYPEEKPSRVTFVGSVYGGPVLMQTPGNPAGTFVTDAARFGKFSPEWVRRFFGR